jgi:hypothetical protein
MEELQEEGKKITLNGEPITETQLQEKQKDASIRIIETAPNSGEYKELQHLRG